MQILSLPTFALEFNSLDYEVFSTSNADTAHRKVLLYFFFLTQTIIIISANIPHTAMCLLWMGLHTSLQSLNLSQVYLSNLQWADMEICQLNPASIKSPFPATFSLCSEKTCFYGCLGKRFCKMYLGELYSLIRNITSALPEEPSLVWDHGCSLMLLGFYRWGLLPSLPAFCVVSLEQILSWLELIPAFRRTWTAVTLTSSGVKSLILQLADP